MTRRLLIAVALCAAQALPAQAARLFNNSATNYLSNAVAACGIPCSMSAWIYPTSYGTSNPEIVGVFQTNGSINNIRLVLLEGAGTPPDGTIEAEVGSAGPAQTTAPAPLNQWSSAIGVYVSTTSRFAYLNGGNVGSSSTSRTQFTSLNGTAIGVVINNSHSNPFIGALADVCIWNAALTAGEAALIGSPGAPGKFPCYLVRPQSLVAYWPLYGGTGNEPDYSGYGNTMLVTGSLPQAAGPPGSPTPLKPGQTIWSRAYLSPSLIGNKPLGVFTPLVGGFTLSLIPFAWREGRRRRAAVNGNLERQRRTES